MYTTTIDIERPYRAGDPYNADLFAMERQSEEGERAPDDDERLDEELEGTFPASDPVPWRHGDQPPKNATPSAQPGDA